MTPDADPAEQANPAEQADPAEQAEQADPADPAEHVEQAEHAEQAELAEGTAPQSSGERGFWGWVARATALVALISATVTLVYKFWPKPQPVQAAEIPKVRVEPGLTFRQYLHEVGKDPGNLSKKVLMQKGALIQFTIRATGYKDKHLRLKWELIDLGTHNRVVESDAITVTPGADTDRLDTYPAFAPFPKRGGPLFQARGELFAPDEVSLDDATKNFEKG